MALHQCPGPERKKPDVPQELPCPDCGALIEIWSRETKATCPKCRRQFARERLEGGRTAGKKAADGGGT